jgi:hypothetical protein
MGDFWNDPGFWLMIWGFLIIGISRWLAKENHHE